MLLLRQTRVASIAFIVALALTGSTVSGQISARQGEKPVQEFESPMILELPLPQVLDFATGYGKTFSKDIESFVCDDTSIVTLTVIRGKSSGRGDKAKILIDFEGQIYVRPSFDRLVDVEFSVLQGENSIGETAAREIDAGEEYKTKFKATLKLPLQDLEEAFAGEMPPILKIVMSVIDND